MRRLVLLAVALLAGCGGAATELATPLPSVSMPPQSNETATSASDSPEPSVAPSPTHSLDELAAAYRACMKPYVEASTELNKQFEKATSLSALKNVAKGFAESESAVINCLRAVQWTPDVAEDATSLLKEVSTIQTIERAMSESSTRTEFDRYYDKWLDQAVDVSAAANLLRGDLGLSQTG